MEQVPSKQTCERIRFQTIEGQQVRILSGQDVVCVIHRRQFTRRS